MRYLLLAMSVGCTGTTQTIGKVRGTTNHLIQEVELTKIFYVCDGAQYRLE